MRSGIYVSVSDIIILGYEYIRFEFFNNIVINFVFDI